MDLTSAFWYVVGIVAVLVFIQVFSRQLEMLLRVLGNSILGGLALWVVNAVGAPAGFHVALNPVSAVLAGLLGVPGVVSMVIARRFLG